MFFNGLKQLKNSHTESITRKKTNYRQALKPWMDYELRNVLRIKLLWYKKMKRARRLNISLYDLEKIKYELKYWEQKFRQLRSIKKTSFIQQKIQLSMLQPNKVWGGIQCALADGVVKGHQTIKIVTNNNIVLDNNQIANEFNDYFFNVGQQLLAKFSNAVITYTPSTNYEIIHPFELLPTNVDEVRNMIISLKNTSAKGFDGFNTQIVKKCVDEFCQPLTQIINKSFEDGVFPSYLKTSKIVPVHKKGSKTNVENYRPIAICSVFSKILEGIYKKRLQTHIDRNKLLCKEQYGFRQSSNTSVALFDLCTAIQTHMDKKKKISTMFLDLQKAFDSVNIDIMMVKLKEMGITSKASDWIYTFLSGRNQYVNVNGTDSDVHTINCGVTQGSILGPVLFLLFINDITKLPLFGRPFLFADDIALLYHASDNMELETQMNTDLSAISIWLQDNKLCLNVVKTNYIMFNSTTSINVLFEGEPIEQVSEFRYLGIILDSNLNFKSHTSTIIRKLSSIVGVFRRIGKYLNDQIRRAVFYSLFHCHVTYGIAIWGSVNKTKLAELQIMQNKAIKALYQLNYRESTEYIHNQYKIQRINIVYHHKLLNITHNIINNQIHSNTDFTFNNMNHQYHTRTASHLFISNHHPKSIKYKAITTYNKIPDSMKNLNKKDFKKQTSNHSSLNII